MKVLSLLRKRYRARKARPRRLATPLRLEPLEKRQMLAVDLAVFVDGEAVDIPANIGVQGGTNISPLYTDGTGALQIAPVGGQPLPDKLTLGDFFDTWRTNAGQAGNNASAIFTDSQILGHVVGGDHTLRMFVNGNATRMFEDYAIEDGDEIAIVYTTHEVASINTNLGSILLELYQEQTPGTVNNFLNYVNDGDYVRSFFHRSDPDFVIQAGGFTTQYDIFYGTWQFSQVPTDPPVQNEPGISNTRGTVAMAKLSGNPNSATSQFFVNLGNNSFLDSTANNAFTVFGRVLDMTTVDAIAELSVNHTHSSPYNELPLTEDNKLVVMQSITGEGTVTGTAFRDLNRNGTQDSGETGLAGATVYADANGNGSLDDGEYFTTADSNGHYQLRLPAGDYILRQQPSQDLLPTVPDATGKYQVTVEIGRETDDYDFANVDDTPPTGVADTYAVNEDATLTVTAANGVLVNDTNPPGGSITAVLGSGPAHGTLTLNADGSFTYVPTANYHGADSFTYRARNQYGDSALVTVTLTVNTMPDPPQAADNAFTVSQSGGTQTFLVLANDSTEPDGTQSLDITAVTQGTAGGTVTISSDGQSVRYTPATGYTGTDTFTYTIRDSDGLTDQATVTVTVTSQNNSPPLAVADTYTVNEDATLTVTAANGVLANDSNPPGGSMTAVLGSSPAHGTLTLNANGSFTYVPSANYHGTDSFTYRARNANGDSSAVTGMLTVHAVADPPKAVNDTFVVSKGSAAQTLDVLDNDSTQPDGSQSLGVIAVTQGSSGGAVAISSDGKSIRYTPAAGFSGTETFTYTIRDADNLTAQATATVNVTGGNSSGGLSTISGYVYCDFDNNGRRDAAEIGLYGVLITLAGTDSQGKAVSATTLSSNDGAYSFDNLAPGTYSVTQQQPEAIRDGQDAIGTLGGVVGADKFTNIVLAAGQHSAENNFGERGLKLQYVGLNLFLGSTPPLQTYLPNLMAGAEERAGHVQLAGWIRNGYDTPGNTGNAPVAKNDTYSVNKNSTLTVNTTTGVLANDTDGDNDTLTAAIATQPSHGTLTLNANGSFTYVPNTGFHGTDSFTYRASDGALQSSPATVTITVQATNSAPAAVNDTYAVNKNTTLTVNTATGVLANDTDADNNTLTAVIATQPSHGTLTLNANGSFTYVPNTGFHGTDSFTYRASDGALQSSPATVTITVHENNSAPAAVNDSYSANKNTTLTVNTATGVLANDTDADSDTLTAVIATQPSHGTLALHANGSFTYVPNTGFHGTDSFTYRASDGALQSNPATVTITVQGTNGAPAAVNDTYTANRNTTLTVNTTTGVLANDTDADNDTLTAAIATHPTHGTLTLNPNGSFTYVPNAGFLGTDSFTYRASDGALQSSPATVSITVQGTNSAPAAVNDTYRVAVNGELVISAASGVLTNDTDPESDALVAVIATQPSHGTLTFNANGSFTYTPNNDFRGTDSFTYTASDGAKASSAATVTIHVNTLPEVEDDSYQSNEDTELVINAAAGVLNNDSDADGDTLSVTLASGPSHGTLELDADGSFTYTPAANFSGTDTFTYKVSDGLETSAEATVTITVLPVNDPPVAEDDAYFMPTSGGFVHAAFGVLANDTDVDGGALTASIATAPSHGTVVLGTDGSFTYTPDESFHGVDSFTYVANDGTADSAEATVTITVHPENGAPIAVDDAYRAAVDGTLTVDALSGVFANDTDPDGNILTVADVVALPAHGSLEFHEDGSFTYTPGEGFHGVDTFKYTASDGSLTSNEATVTIHVNALPEIENDSYQADEDTELVINAAAGVLNNDSDADGDTLSVTVASGPSHGTLELSADGSFTYTPAADFFGTDTFTYQVSDGLETSAEATVTITVLPVNDPPAAEGDSYTVAEGGELVVDASTGVLANDDDADGSPATPRNSLVITEINYHPHAPTAEELAVDPDLESDDFEFIELQNVGEGTIDLAGVYFAGGIAFSFTGSSVTQLDPGETVLVVSNAAAFAIRYDTDAGVAGEFQSGPLSDTGETISLKDALDHAILEFAYGSGDGWPAEAAGGGRTLEVADVAGDYGDSANWLPSGETGGTPGQGTDATVAVDYLMASLVQSPSHGQLSFNPDGFFHYVPNAGYSGSDQFTYRASDGTDESSETTVTIEVGDSGN